MTNKLIDFSRERALLIDIIDPSCSKEESELRLFELESLVKTYGGISVLKMVQRRSVPAYKTYVGTGKLKELLDELDSSSPNGIKGIDVIIVNNLLKPKQIYNIEEFCINYQIDKKEEDPENPRFENPKKIKVWDRVDLILKIFDKHANSAEAKLQIELASIKHMGPRIFGMGLELSRQAGGIGTLGIGETNIQIMKRHLQRRTKLIEDKIKFYENVQRQHREARRNKNLKTVSLVGYTNAGKSTLIKALTKKKDVYIADELFATLDSKVGELYLSSGSKIIVADTIGFIQYLPPDLIKAFKSTLAEIIDADLILHVIDVSDKNIDTKISVVEEILSDLGVQDKPKIYVFNKMDLLDEELSKEENHQDKKSLLLENLKQKYIDFNPQFLSALDKNRLEDLIEAIKQFSFNQCHT
jgi:GTPase